MNKGYKDWRHSLLNINGTWLDRLYLFNIFM